jgi:hypothetical protein
MIVGYVVLIRFGLEEHIDLVYEIQLLIFSAGSTDILVSAEGLDQKNN